MALRALLQRGAGAHAGLIGECWVPAASDPATGCTVASTAAMDVKDVQHAIAEASAAQGAWGDTTAGHRADVLLALHAGMLEAKEDLARIMVAESGKPWSEALGEVAYAAGYMRWFAEEARRAYGDVIPASAPGRHMLTTHAPVGVCALITPWNFPLAMVARKLAPALAAGCTAVLKPSEDTPLTALALGHLAVAAGVPAGVVNVLPVARPEASAVGQELATSPKVGKVSFTGSTAVGKVLLAAGASTVKRASMELGGNAPFIVFDDADVDAAVAGTLACKFRFGGQTCVSANRLLVQEGVAAEYTEKLVAAVAGLRRGDPADPDTDLGPLINAAAVDKVEGLVQQATAAGAQVLLGGTREAPSEALAGGSHFAPTVLSGVRDDMRCSQEEVFGPVAPIAHFQDEEEALHRANATRTGLAGYVFTRDYGRAWRAASGLRVGMLAVNEGILSTETAPFGGVRESGLGREGGWQGLADYLDTKYVVMGGVGRSG